MNRKKTLPPYHNGHKFLSESLRVRNISDVHFSSFVGCCFFFPVLMAMPPPHTLSSHSTPIRASLKRFSLLEPILSYNFTTCQPITPSPPQEVIWPPILPAYRIGQESFSSQFHLRIFLLLLSTKSQTTMLTWYKKSTSTAAGTGQSHLTSNEILFNKYNRGDSDGEESASNAGGPGLIPGSGRSPGEGNGYPLQYSCLENSMSRGAWAGYSPWGCKELDKTDQH